MEPSKQSYAGIVEKEGKKPLLRKGVTVSCIYYLQEPGQGFILGLRESAGSERPGQWGQHHATVPEHRQLLPTPGVPQPSQPPRRQPRYCEVPEKGQRMALLVCPCFRQALMLHHLNLSTHQKCPVWVMLHAHAMSVGSQKSAPHMHQPQPKSPTRAVQHGPVPAVPRRRPQSRFPSPSFQFVVLPPKGSELPWSAFLQQPGEPRGKGVP